MDLRLFLNYDFIILEGVSHVRFLSQSFNLYRGWCDCVAHRQMA